MMGFGVAANVVLDHARFEVTPSKNRYEALAYSHGEVEKLASGPLDQLAIHLPEAQGFLHNEASSNFQLALDGCLRGISWFNKCTLSRFLHIVNARDVLKGVNAIENEMSQLEETKRFQLKLYAKEGECHLGGEPDLQHHFRGEDIPSSDVTKNGLFRAMDLRLSVLNEDLVTTFNQAVGSTCSTKEISDLAAFCQHFGATNLRNFCAKILLLLPKDQTSDNAQLQPKPLDGSSEISEDGTEYFNKVRSQENALMAGNNLPPAKNAEAECQSTTESVESSNSSDEGQPIAERSRSLMRSASPRRSASPMRRIQIGRSGSRRSTSLSIKRLNYFPARDRIIIKSDTDSSNSGDEDSGQPSKRPESSVRRMSVQDAISLFESKQKADNTDTQKQRASEMSSMTNKSVLRRWSAGMGDSLNRSAQENISGTELGNPLRSTPKPEELELNDESDNFRESPKPVESTQDGASLEQESSISHIVEDLLNKEAPKAEEARERSAASAEWTRQKEAELNQILMKMMESKHGKFQAPSPVCDGHEVISSEQREDFCTQSTEKKDEKLQAENAGTQTVKEAQVRRMQKTFGHCKAEISAKKGVTEGKNGSSTEKSRRNSSSPNFSKREYSKPVSSRKASPKSSSLPVTRSSLSAGTLTKTTVAQTKAAPTSTLNRRKSQPTPSPTRPSPIKEKVLQQPKVRKPVLADSKPSVGRQDMKQQKRLINGTKDAKERDPSDSQDDSTGKSAKPSFYNKVTKKNSVVPLEPKPFLRKGTRTSPSVGYVLPKPKVYQLDESSKNCKDVTEGEKGTPELTVESTGKAGDDLAQSTHIVDRSIESQPVGDKCVLDAESPESPHQSLTVLEAPETLVQNPSSDLQQDVRSDADPEISSAAWVEAERQEVPESPKISTSEIAASRVPAPIPSSSPRIYHSLSQMLQADTSEPEIIEWGNAENPPSFFYQKDSPKGLKRLLKFGRKSKCENTATRLSSPSVFSEGEDDKEESKAASKRSSDTFLRKAIQAKSYSQQNISLTQSFDGAQSNAKGGPASGNAKSKGQSTDATTFVKGTRSFFSLSTFRSSKSNEAKR